MTELLQQDIEEIKKLSAKEQDAFAKFILLELASERKWKELFDSTSDEQRNQLLKEVRKGIIVSESLSDLIKPKRKLGSMKGKIIMSDDFDEPLDDFKEYM